MAPLTDVELFFGRLEVLLGHAAGLKPIVFHLVDTRETWSFDPERGGRRFLPGPVADAALEIWASSSVLLRAITTTGVVKRPEEVFEYHGEIDVLSGLVERLDSPH